MNNPHKLTPQERGITPTADFGKGMWGTCYGIPFKPDLKTSEFVTPDEPPNHFFECVDNTTAYCEDASSYSASTTTLESFYCANFKQKGELS